MNPMPQPLPLTRDLVLIGGGHAHALVLRMWGMDPLPGARLTLINPGPTAPYSGMLPGHIAGHYGRDELDIDLVKLARFAGARLIIGAAEAIDPFAKTVTVGARRISYDVASIDVGIHAEMPGIEGFKDHALGAKPLDIYANGWRDYLAALAPGDQAEIAVIGGGVAGVELALAMRFAARAFAPRVSVIEAGEGLSGVSDAARGTLLDAMRAADIAFRPYSAVARISADGVALEGGDFVAANFVVGAAGAYAHPWLAASDLPTQDGYVLVDPTLEVQGHEGLFAVGDCAHMPHAPRPKAGVYAVRAAPVLAANLRAALKERGEMRAFNPQSDFLKLISLGGKSAMAQKWGRALSGPALWRWKNHIDQSFMEKFRDLPSRPPAPVPRETAAGLIEALEPGGKMMCGGCGAKVGAGTLAGALAALDPPSRADVIKGAGDDAAVLKMGRTRQVITTDHLRVLTEDPALFARIALIHALGDVWSMGAAAQAVLMSVTLPKMNARLQARTMAEIMAAAEDVARQAGAEIVGGHSTMGAEMALGFCVTGLLERAPITQAGAKPGDVLVLTRPIGTGVLLAGEMAGRARGADVAHVLGAMAAPQGDVAAALSRARAMTDVTGFGLAGHVLAMCKASKVSAEITLADVPTYPGAEALAAAGVRSSIWADNAMAAPVSGALGSQTPLLHDPQTAGGFLAALAPKDVEAALARARAAGANPVVIGRMVEASGPAEITAR